MSIEWEEFKKKVPPETRSRIEKELWEKTRGKIPEEASAIRIKYWGRLTTVVKRLIDKTRETGYDPAKIDWDIVAVTALDYDTADAVERAILDDPKYAGLTRPEDITPEEMLVDPIERAEKERDALEKIIGAMVTAGIEETVLTEQKEQIDYLTSKVSSLQKQRDKERVVRKRMERLAKREKERREELEARAEKKIELIKRRKGLWEEAPMYDKAMLYEFWKGKIKAKVGKYPEEVDGVFEVVWEELKRDLAKEWRDVSVPRAIDEVERRAQELAEKDPKLRRIAVQEAAERRRMIALEKKKEKVPTERFPPDEEGALPTEARWEVYRPRRGRRVEVTGPSRTLIEEKLLQFFSPEDVNEIKIRCPIRSFITIYGWLLSEDPSRVEEAAEYLRREIKEARDVEAQFEKKEPEKEEEKEKEEWKDEWK